MVRQGLKRAQEVDGSEEDLKFLLSNIRARENGLVFFLELFSLANQNRLTPEQYRTSKQQFIDKQKLYSTTIRQLIITLNQCNLSSNQFRGFWVKLKSILRVTLERLRTLGLLSSILGKRYEEIITCIDTAYEGGANISDYVKVEQLVKRRTIEALIASKNIQAEPLLGAHSQDYAKNRSQTFFKLGKKQIENLNFSPNKRNSPQVQNLTTEDKLKSITKVRRKQSKKPKIGNTQIKKSQIALIRNERNFVDLMSCKIDCKLDKLKSKTENYSAIYDTLFNRNISNHKTIAKYVHSHAKLELLLASLKKPKQRPNISQNKLNRGVRGETIHQEKDKDKVASRQRLTRPKTAKLAKQASKITNPKHQKLDKISQLIRCQ